MRQLSFFPLPAPRDPAVPSPRAARPGGATIRLADVRPGATRPITYAASAYNGARSYYAVYEAHVTNDGGQPHIQIGRQIAGYSPADIVGPQPATPAEYRALWLFLARQHSTAARPALEE